MHRATIGPTVRPEAVEPSKVLGGFRTVSDVLQALSDVPAERIRLIPTPGTATEQDVIAVQDRENLTCELIHGTLVEKTMGYEEGLVAVELITELNLFLRRHHLGVVNGPDGTLKLTSGLLRVPDVTFVSWDRLPGRRPPRQPVPTLALDLAVEVISQGNTKAEMERKLQEYFEAGTRLVWFLFPKTKTARVYTSTKRSKLLKEHQSLEGGEVLPGFRLSLRDLFARAHRGPDD